MYEHIRMGGFDWICVAHDMEKWRTVVKTVMNIWVPHRVGKFLSR
jgi:hypothetical protein